MPCAVGACGGCADPRETRHTTYLLYSGYSKSAEQSIWIFRYPQENPDPCAPLWVQCAVRGSHSLHSAAAPLPPFPLPPPPRPPPVKHKSSPPRPAPRMNVCCSRTPPGSAGSAGVLPRPPPSPPLLLRLPRVPCSPARRSCIRGIRPGVLACPSPPAAMVRALSSADVGMSVLPPPLLLQSAVAK